MVRTSQRTIFSFDIELYRQLNKQYKPLPNTTLNEKYRILENEEVPIGVYPILQGFIIGIGGLASIENTSNYVFSEHSPLDGCLYEGIPWVIRPIDKDLEEDERSKYRLRTIETINNETYICYYMKAIDNVDIKQEFYIIKAASPEAGHGSPSLKPLDTQDATILNPVPKVRNLNYESSYIPKYVTKIAKIVFEISPEEQKYIRDALEIKGYGNRIITEIGLCSGIDTVVENHKESIITQVAYHLGVNIDLAIALSEEVPVFKGIEIGGLEPLIM